MHDLVHYFFDQKIVCFGDFVLKSGKHSPIYFDFRKLVSSPQHLKQIGDALLQKTTNLDYELLCGVPYTALPIATAMSLSENKPMIFMRKESKSYGLKQDLEGVYKQGQKVLVVEDLVTSAQSSLAVCQKLQSFGLEVVGIVVILDRQQGGRNAIEKQGLQFFALWQLCDLLENFLSLQLIDTKTFDSLKRYFSFEGL